jgi:hypothetical protein
MIPQGKYLRIYEASLSSACLCRQTFKTGFSAQLSFAFSNLSGHRVAIMVEVKYQSLVTLSEIVGG